MRYEIFRYAKRKIHRRHRWRLYRGQQVMQIGAEHRLGAVQPQSTGIVQPALRHPGFGGPALVLRAAEIDAYDGGSSHNAAIIGQTAPICKAPPGRMTETQKPGRMAATRSAGGRPIMRQPHHKIYALTLIALLLAAIGYMSYAMAQQQWALLVAASPGARASIISVLALIVIMIVWSVVVAAVSARNGAANSTRLLRKAYGLTLIALLLAGVGYMFYGTAPMVSQAVATASPGARVQIGLVLTLVAIIIVCRIIVAVLDQMAKRTAA